MDPRFMQVGFAVVDGLTTGMAVFLVAAGITLIFGVLKVLNFAHGSFFMIGAYITYTLIGDDPSSLGLYLVVSVAAGLAVGVLGYVVDLLVLRRLRQVEEAYSLIATFALLMACDGMVRLIWGASYHSVSAPDMIGGTVQLGPMQIPTYSLLVVLASVLVFLALDFATRRSWIGKIVQALVNDPWMSSLIGVNVELLFTGTVIVAFFLAGLAGGLLLPNQSLSPELSSSYLMQAFIVVIIGGLGNIRGAFLASILLGLIDSLNTIFLPVMPGVAIYVAMAGFLLWRPQGLLAREGANPASHGIVEQVASRARLAPGAGAALGVAAAAILLAAPFWADEGLVFVIGVGLIEALFALSWNLLFGFTGLTSFGHAALFAIGAYTVGFVLKTYTIVPFLLLLVGAGVAAGLVAAVVGAIVVGRAAGIGLGVLTLAMSEVLHIILSDATSLGRTDGLPSVPRPNLISWPMTVSLGSTSSYYWFLCAVCGGVALLLWLMVSGPFGRVLRCIKQDPDRMAFLGVKVSRYRLIAFTVSGLVAGLSGGLLAPWTQIVTPDLASYMHSAQPMLNALLGGTGSFWGPVLGTALFTALQYGTRTFVGLSDVISGVLLLVIVVWSPNGALGALLRTLAQLAPMRRRKLARLGGS
jgi:branched-chain amino acid transport system permease protein